MTVIWQTAAGCMVLAAVSFGSQWYAVETYKRSLIEQAEEIGAANAQIVKGIMEDVQNEDRDSIIDTLTGGLRRPDQD